MSPTATAAQAVEAAADLLRYVQEGGVCAQAPFGDADPVAKLCDALIGAAEIERAYAVGHADRKDEHEAFVALIAAVDRHRTDWAR
jgi:hypothetical protein